MHTIICTRGQPEFAEYVFSQGHLRPEDCEVVEWPKKDDIAGAHLIGFGLPLSLAVHAARVTLYMTYFPSTHKNRTLLLEELAECIVGKATYEVKRVG